MPAPAIPADATQWSINSLRVFASTAAGNATLGGVPVTGCVSESRRLTDRPSAATSSSSAPVASATSTIAPAVINAAQTTAAALPSATAVKLKSSASTVALPLGALVATALALLTLA